MNPNEVWFHDRSGTYKGYVEKINRDTVNVIVPADNQLWRVTQYFLSNSAEEAIEKWNDYRRRLAETKNILSQRRIIYEYHKGLDIIVQPNDKHPYSAVVLSVDRITLIIHTEYNEFMRVDKAICTPT